MSDTDLVEIEIKYGNEIIELKAIQNVFNTCVEIKEWRNGESTSVHIPIERVVQLANALKLLKRGK